MNDLKTVSFCDENEMEQILVAERTDKSHWYETKTLKMLINFGRFLFVDNHKQIQQIKSYKKLLKKLENKEISLKEKLKDENIERNRKTIEMRLTINCVQRRKAIAAINKLKNSN